MTPRWFAALLYLGLFGFALTVAAADDEKATKLTEKNDGEKIKLAKGATLEIRLPGNRTTGFSWSVAKNDKDVLKPPTEIKYERSKSKLIGAGGTDVIIFTAEKVGTSEVELHYKRGFEKDKAPAKTYKLTVTVE